VICLKRSHDRSFEESLVLPLELPIDLPYSRDITLVYQKNYCSFEYDFTLNINCKLNVNDQSSKTPELLSIQSMDDIETITLSRKCDVSTKLTEIENNYQHWSNILTKRTKEVVSLKEDRSKILKILDGGESILSEDATIEDVILITEKIKNHNNEINIINTTTCDIEYEDVIKIERIDLVCGTIKSVSLMENYSKQKIQNGILYDIFWSKKNDYNLSDCLTLFRTEILSNKKSTINVPKIRK